MFYDGKIYFWMMIELMFFVFIVLYTQGAQIRILHEMERQSEHNYMVLTEQLKENPEMIHKILEFRDSLKK